MQKLKILPDDQTAQNNPMEKSAHASSRRAGFFHPLSAIKADISLEDTPTINLWPALTLLFLLSIGAFGWASKTQVHEAASAPGQIVTTAPVITLQHWDGGLVQDVDVREGDHVTKGQTLLRLDPGNSFNSFGALDAELKGKSDELARWKIIRDALTRSGPAQASAAPDALEKLSADQRASVVAVLGSYRADIQLMKEDAAAARARALSLAAQEHELAQSSNMIEEKIAMRDTLYRRGVGTRLSLLEARREGSILTEQKAELDGERQVALLTASRLAAEQLARRDKLLEQATDRITSLGSEIASGNKDLAQLSDKVNRLIVTSPVDGRVQRLGPTGAGAVIAPGGLVAEIVPDNSTLAASVRLYPRDRGFVSVGQAAKLKIHSFDFARYGTLPATVSMISPTTLFDEHQQPYYEVRLALDPRKNNIFADGMPLQPGMTVQADIMTGRKTILQYLLKPIYETSSGALHER